MTDDLIGRAEAQTAIQFAAKRYTVAHEAHGEGQVVWSDNLINVTDAMNALRDLPSAQPEQRWIPVIERLPDDLAEVNVTWINHEPEPYYDFVKDKPFTASAIYYKGDWYWYSSVCVDVLAEYGENRFDKIADVIEITAWMPFPEPYQKRGDQDGMEK